jgi:hypothetical protein
MLTRTFTTSLAITAIGLSACGSDNTDDLVFRHNGDGNLDEALAAGGLVPDLQTVVPAHVQIQNKQQSEVLRFSNGIANRGEGPLQFRAETVSEDNCNGFNPCGDEEGGAVTVATQDVLDENGDVVYAFAASEFEFHPTHNHWHIADVALFGVHRALDDGTGGAYAPEPAVGVNGEAVSQKTTFCLIDWYKIDDNSPNKERTYWDCNAATQGISPGWVDQYHQSTDDQDLDITGLPAGTYYLVSTANSDHAFLEPDYSNNTAWWSFELERGGANPKAHYIANSPCDTPNMCGEGIPNR